MKKTIFILISIILISCTEKNEKFKDKGFQVDEIESENAEVNSKNAIKNDSLNFKSKSVDVLLTGNKNIRLSPIYKVNYSEKEKKFFTGSNDFHYGYNDDNPKDGNNWNSVIPGFEALFGYNLMNIFHFNHTENRGKKLFKKPVLIKTCYYPSFKVDTLNFKPVQRNFYMISAYDEDTNKDKYINNKDLRRFYLFDINGENLGEIVPKNHSVIGAMYDSGNDYLYIDAKLDSNKDGKISEHEPVSIFYLDLKNPMNKGLFYKN
jgi:hypothetical protein